MVKKKQEGSRVIWTDSERKQHRARVTQVLTKRRRIITDTGKRRVVNITSLKSLKDRVLILEGRLDRSLFSKRTFGPMLQQMLSAYCVRADYERIHTVSGLRGFLKAEGRDPRYRIVQIICHGKDLKGRNNAELQLTHDKVDLLENLDMFAGLKGKVIILCACDIGRETTLLKKIKQVSNARAVIAYRKKVYDTYTNLAEALLYEQLLSSDVSPKTAVERASEALRTVNAYASDEPYRGNVMVCV